MYYLLDLLRSKLRSNNGETFRIVVCRHNSPAKRSEIILIYAKHGHSFFSSFRNLLRMWQRQRPRPRQQLELEYFHSGLVLCVCVLVIKMRQMPNVLLSFSTRLKLQFGQWSSFSLFLFLALCFLIHLCRTFIKTVSLFHRIVLAECKQPKVLFISIHPKNKRKKLFNYMRISVFLLLF